MINEVTRTTKSNGGKHRMLIPVYKDDLEAIEVNHFGYTEKAFSANSKEKRKMDVLTLAELTPNDVDFKRTRVGLTFGYQASAMLRNAIQFVCGKYDKKCSEIFDELDKKNIEPRKRDMTIFSYNWEYLPMFKPDAQNTDWANDILFNIVAYFTNDETIVKDNTCLLMSRITELFYEYNIVNYPHPEVIASLIEGFVNDMFDILLVTFSKLFCLARDYYQYTKYQALEDAREAAQNNKILLEEQECKESDVKE